MVHTWRSEESLWELVLSTMSVLGTGLTSVLTAVAFLPTSHLADSAPHFSQTTHLSHLSLFDLWDQFAGY